MAGVILATLGAVCVAGVVMFIPLSVQSITVRSAVQLKATYAAVSSSNVTSHWAGLRWDLLDT